MVADPATLARGPADGATLGDKWGETPCVFIELRPGMTATEAEPIAHVRSLIAHCKPPRAVVIGEIPKSSTGQVQKHVLRLRVRVRRENGRQAPASRAARCSVAWLGSAPSPTQARERAQGACASPLSRALTGSSREADRRGPRPAGLGR